MNQNHQKLLYAKCKNEVQERKVKKLQQEEGGNSLCLEPNEVIIYTMESLAPIMSRGYSISMNMRLRWVAKVVLLKYLHISVIGFVIDVVSILYRYCLLDTG